MYAFKSFCGIQNIFLAIYYDPYDYVFFIFKDWLFTSVSKAGDTIYFIKENR